MANTKTNAQLYFEIITEPRSSFNRIHTEHLGDINIYLVK